MLDFKGVWNRKVFTPIEQPTEASQSIDSISSVVNLSDMLFLPYPPFPPQPVLSQAMVGFLRENTDEK